MPHAFRIGVLASGRGSNLQVLLDQCASGAIPAEVAVIGVNRAEAQAVGRAELAGVPCVVADRAEYRRRPDRQATLAAALRAARVDLVVLAGYDEILVPAFVAAFQGRIVNLHPSLLPAFGGTLHAIKEALEHGVKVTGVTVHLVTDAVDAGPILAQAAVDVLPDDDEASLHHRIQREEHRLLPLVVGAFAEGRVHADPVSGHTWITESSMPRLLSGLRSK